MSITLSGPGDPPIFEWQSLRTICPLFASLDDLELQALTEASPLIRATAGDLVISKGEEAKAAFIILEGRLAALVTRVWGEDRILNEIGTGGLVGEIELLNGDRSMIDIRAMEDSLLLVLSREIFEGLMESHLEVWQRVSRLARSNTCRLLLSRQLNHLLGGGMETITDPMLRLKAEQDWLDFEDEILQDLEKHVDWVTLDRGQVLFRQGDQADSGYVLVSGRIQISISDENGLSRVVGQLSKGDIAGEIAFIMKQDRMATLTALRDCELFRLPRELFTQVSERYPQIMLSIYQTILGRFSSNVSGSVFHTRSPSIAILSASSEFPLSDFMLKLKSAMAPYGRIGHLSSESVAESLGRPGIAQSRPEDPANVRLVQWLNGREVHYDHVLYQGDRYWTAWTERCLRQADRLLIVADVREKTNAKRLMSRLSGFGLTPQLVLVHPEDTNRPRNTARWVAAYGTDTVFHLRRNHEGDLSRLARILAGRALGLVLGGGGARGFAHLGVLLALEELGIEVDMIGGTSIGAPLAGWVAQSMNAGECLVAAKKTFSSLIDPTLPATAMLSGRRISRAINTETAAWDIEDYWLPFFCVSTSLTTGEAKIHRRGNSARAIRSSVSIPGVLPPVPEKDELLVDGSVLNNLPIDIMRTMNPFGTIIALDVVADRGMKARGDYGLSVSGWREGLSRFNPWRRSVRSPNIGSIIMQSMMAGSNLFRAGLLEQGLANFYLKIDVASVGLLQFEAVAVQTAADIGYEASIGPLREWQASRDNKQH
jgi:predicted acylesterase/phospholipase RssA/CRP-like cAMP-binding protein